MNRERWLDQLGSIVDPADVRWIFVSHDDIDHVGNLAVLLDLCPRAIVLTTWFAVRRMETDQGLVLPMNRVRFVNDGEAVDVGDRVLRAVLPPVFDKPTTRGLFDPVSGFCWAADCFCAPVPEFLPEAADVPAVQWREGFLAMHRLLSPWHALLDHRRFAAAVDRVQRLPLSVVCGAHGPIVRGARVADAFRMLRELPHISALTPFTQADLEDWLVDAATVGEVGPDRVPQVMG